MEPQPKLTFRSSSQAKQQYRQSRRGVALVLVLIVLTLIVVTIVAMLGTVSSDNITSHAQAASADAKRLADMSVQLVLAQIRDATTDNQGDVTETWASQPGVIRVYSNAGGTTGGLSSNSAALSPLAKAYKLYSADQMIATAYDPKNDWAPASWDNSPELYTDVNSPLNDSTGSKIYPILDPAAVQLGVTDPYSGYTPTSSLGVEGCSVDTTAAPVSGKSNPVAMPVKWLYVLQDGTLSSATTAGTGLVTVTGATTANPVIGRIAFWTDDDTCKLNINTAGEYSPWFTPRYDTTQDIALAQYQPTDHEFNRIGGHPATTCLSPVFWKLLGLTDPNETLWPVPSIQTFDADKGDPAPKLSPNADKYFKALYGTSGIGAAAPILPRVVYADGGSKEGTASTASIANPTYANGEATNFRLYSDVDELAFASPNSPNTSLSKRPVNSGFANPNQVAQLRFFLTSNSRAPELNLFHQPRVTIWPIPDWQNGKFNPVNPNFVKFPSPFDQTIAFCSTLNGKSYIFGRFDPTDPQHDYLQGSGYAYTGTSPGRARNPFVWNYIRSQMNKNIPGFGGSFIGRSDLSGVKCDELTTLFFDFIRSQINLIDSSYGSGAPTATPGGINGVEPWFYRSYTAPTTFSTSGTGLGININQGLGLVAPTQLANGTHGTGRFPVIKSVTLIFTADAANQPPEDVDANGKPTGFGPNVMHPFWPIAPRAGVHPSTFTVTPNPTPATPFDDRYPAWKAATNSLIPLASSNPATYPQNGVTHAGLRFLPILDQNPGAGRGTYDLPNTKYPNTNPALATYQTWMEAALFIDVDNPSPGNSAFGPGYQIDVTGFSIPVSSSAGSYTLTIPTGSLPISAAKGGLNLYSGNIGVYGTVFVKNNRGGTAYPFLSANAANASNQRVIVGPSAGYPHGEVFTFAGTTVNIKLSMLPNGRAPVAVSTLAVNFPAERFPTPKLANYWQIPNPANPASNILADPTVVLANVIGTTQIGLFNRLNAGTWSTIFGNIGNNTTAFYAPEVSYKSPISNNNSNLPYYKVSADTYRSVECLYGDFRVASGLKTLPPIPNGATPALYAPHSFYTLLNSQYLYGGNNNAPYYLFIRNAHTLRGGFSQDYLTPGCTARYLNDYANFVTNQAGFSAANAAGTTAPFRYFMGYDSNPFNAKLPSSRNLWWDYALPDYTGPAPGLSGNKSKFPEVTSTADFSDTNFANLWKQGGDFTSPAGDVDDGGFVDKPDEGQRLTTSANKNTVPYYGTGSPAPTGGALFSPIRQVPSAVAFGSLPVGLAPDSSNYASVAWHTLQFSPNPNNLDKGRIIQNNPPDYLLLDLFQMPVVEPYAISGPMSTAGKVNMNYQIAPFSYITRNTALRGVLKGTTITAVNDQFIKWYKILTNGTTFNDNGVYDGFGKNSGFFNFHYPVHTTNTLRQFDYRFNTVKDLFHSPAEICSIWLYPGQQPQYNGSNFTAPAQAVSGTTDVAGSIANIKNWWYNNPGTDRKGMTADNVRERPYAELYPRLTTQSNTYTIHYKVQLLKKSPNTPPGTWAEPSGPGINNFHDIVASEYRGSTSIERYLDPNDTNIPDFASGAAVGSNSSQYNLDTYYKYRIVSSRQFAP